MKNPFGESLMDTSLMEQLISELKVKIVDLLDLTNIQPEDIDADSPLIGGKLELDSIDVLEMVIMIEKDYGLRIENRELGEKVFATLAAMATYIADNAPGPLK
ncbi:MAG: phosphopantetheine-binding protein [Desulfobacterales bacterium]|jgi:acyl carrier protein